MFQPIIPSSYVFREGEAKNIEHTGDIFHQDRRSPSRWDYFLLYIGNVLINVGQKVRKGSSFVDCSEANILHTDASAGNA